MLEESLKRALAMKSHLEQIVWMIPQSQIATNDYLPSILGSLS